MQLYIWVLKELQEIMSAILTIVSGLEGLFEIIDNWRKYQNVS